MSSSINVRMIDECRCLNLSFLIHIEMNVIEQMSLILSTYSVFIDTFQEQYQIKILK